MEKKYIQIQNEKLAYIEQGYGDHYLILLHGNMASALYFLSFIESLPKNIHVFAPDFRGFGDSSYNQPIKKLKDLAVDIKLFIDALNLKEVNILGWGMGGCVSMAIASLYPNDINKLILLNSISHKGYPIYKKDDLQKPIFTQGYKSKVEMASDPIDIEPFVQAIAAKNKTYLTNFLETKVYTNNKPNDLEFYAEETLKQKKIIDVFYALACFNISDQKTLYQDGDNLINKLIANTLHIWGDLDVIVSEYMVIDNINAIKNSEYLKLENCGHFPIVDKLEEVKNAIIDFIKK